MEEALTFDDVLLVPQYSDIKSRKDVDISTKLTETITLNIPIIASNMDTVCESAMAIKMAQLGGIGIIHRFLDMEEQASEVSKVKTHHDATIPNPYWVYVGTPTNEAVNEMVEKNVSSLMIIGKEEEFAGMLLLKDLTFCDVSNSVVEEFMVPYGDLVTGPQDITMEDAMKLMAENKVGKLPIVDDGPHLLGLITRKDLAKKENYPMATRDTQGRLMVGAAVGVNGDYLERVEELISSGVDVIVIDIAHGHSTHCISAIQKIKDRFEIPIIGGNVATYGGVLDLIEAGVDGIKVGVGPGSICTTRIVTGHGVPQLSAILNIDYDSEVPIIADGGIRTSGDIVKALAAGASTVMLGSLLAGTDESPGSFIHRDGVRYKMIRGMASFGASLGRNKRAGDKLTNATPEGVEGLIPYRGATEEVVSQLCGGIRSGLSYSGAKNIEDLWDTSEFIKISNSGLVESKYHDINKV